MRGVRIRKVKTMIRYMKNPLKIVRALGRRGWFNWLPDEPYLKLVYWGETGKMLNLDSPVTYNEKLQWLKLYDRKPEYCTYVDKYAVRQHIKKLIGEEYLIPLIAVYDNVDEIKWGELPKKFVLKCTHGSGSNIICTDKNKLDIRTSKIELNKWMKKNWYWFGREWPYKNLKPKIVCETFISETDKTPDDYKVLCFNGKAKLIEIHINRFGDHKQDIYDTQWNKTAISWGFKISDFIYEKPPHFEKMIQLSEQLAADMRHCRIDWFIVQDKLYFGEITFYDGSGFALFDDEEDNYLLGSWINLKEE